jgi:hypothetical protein
MLTTALVFSVENELLGEHPIRRGRNPGEQVRKVLAFTGQSLSVPRNATVLLKISSDATDEDQRKLRPAFRPAQNWRDVHKE